ncbi:hypothetical protein Pcinc_010786 [Petrolisthes cinctipes]|uniref:MULE transposase domain-containing protein n=1 Tax=Petrolisthes cinctipes TaxID=88211 RepID=A0AAE1G8A4_PETCI|nr:hypothetical protein Pcinc_010786 [Petrolisthes cinctipes]
MGFTRSQATRIHQQKLNFNLTDLANHGINPSPRSSAWIREVWLTENHGHLSGESMFSAIQKYKNNNEATRIELEVYDGGNFAIVLVTDLMMRCHQELKSSSEVVFVDTTSHMDQLNTAVTPLLCAGPVGAVPLGIIFSSSQDEISYKRGFQLLKKVLGESGFFGKGSPDCFITDNSDPERKALKEVWPESELYLCIFHILQQVWRWLCDANHGVKKEERQQLIQVMKQLVYAKSSVDFENYWLQ